MQVQLAKVRQQSEEPKQVMWRSTVWFDTTEIQLIWKDHLLKMYSLVV